MTLHQAIDKDFNVRNAVLTTGMFDGVHTGHRKIIERVNDVARNTGGESVILTFFPHPQIVLNPENYSLKLLNTHEEKIELLEKTGVDHVIEIPFTKDFSSLSSDTFIRNILVEKLGVKYLVIGYDHHFGKGRSGNFSSLKENEKQYGFKVEEIPALDIESIAVSSTKIRKALLSGDITTANNYLGYNYFMSGKVVSGRRIGRKIGFPTANITVTDPYKLIPAMGIYAVMVHHSGKLYKGMLSIGTNPTVGGNVLNMEVNIFNFGKDIYNEDLRVYFVEKMREEQKFSDIEALKQQLVKDKIKATELLDIKNIHEPL